MTSTQQKAFNLKQIIMKRLENIKTDKGYWEEPIRVLNTILDGLPVSKYDMLEVNHKCIRCDIYPALHHLFEKEMNGK